MLGRRHAGQDPPLGADSSADGPDRDVAGGVLQAVAQPFDPDADAITVVQA